MYSEESTVDRLQEWLSLPCFFFFFMINLSLVLLDIKDKYWCEEYHASRASKGTWGCFPESYEKCVRLWVLETRSTVLYWDMRFEESQIRSWHVWYRREELFLLLDDHIYILKEGKRKIHYCIFIFIWESGKLTFYDTFHECCRDS